MTNTIRTIALLSFSTVLFFSSCSSEKKADSNKAEEGVATVLPQDKSEVTVLPLKKQLFNHELVSNGKIVACHSADLRFETSEVVARVYVKNGDRVRQGQRLAELDKFRLINKLAQAKEALERSRLELKDVLIGQGYSATDFDRVPQEIMKLAKVKSGYEQSRVQYELAKREEERATLIAPFDGVVANLFVKPHNLANPSETFCTVLDSKNMEVDFSVLESELALIKKGDRVSVKPYADRLADYNGSVIEINPLVDRNGMVRVKAHVDGKGKLFSGMNVRVSVKRALKSCLVIPKTAVVLRSGKQVVFTLSKGQSKWNYVQVELENSESCVVAERLEIGQAEGLVDGDTVIVSGNVNLAHEAPVVVTSVLKN